MDRDAMSGASFDLETTQRGYRLIARGAWVVAHLAAVDDALRAIADKKPHELVLVLHDVQSMDTAGAFVLERTFRECGLRVDFAQIEGMSADHKLLFEAISKTDLSYAYDQSGPAGTLDSLARIGKSVHQAFVQSRSILGLCGEVVVAFGRVIRSPRRLRVVSLVYHMEQAGLDAVPIISLLTFLIGAVVAFLGSSILRTFGAEVFTIELIAYSILRELGILLTAIIVAGRSGSAFTAQIGSMKVNEEIDAMKVLGLDPIEVLVLPRVLAFVIMLPLLGFVADIMGLVGGMLVSMVTLEISPSMYFVRISEFVPINNFWSGLIKAPFFAFIIALIGCHEGLAVEGSAESVGQRTTSSVVQSIFMVIVIDALFAMFYIEVDF